MRIGFMGAQGTGKTTTMQRMLETPGFQYHTPVPSTARLVQQAGYKINRDADRLSQLLTTLARMTMEDQICNERFYVVSDRTPLDSMAYTKYQIEHAWHDVDDFYEGVSESIVRQHMRKYDVLFYFPPYWAPKSDGVRDPDVEYQQEIDRLILFYIDKFDLDPYTVRNESPEARVEYIRACLDSA